MSAARLLIVATLIATLGGCVDAVVSRTPVPGTERIESVVVSCSDGPGGYCYKCGMGFRGYNCDYSYKFSCPGSQPVTRKVWDEVLYHESGKIQQREGYNVISVDGPCK